MPATIVPQVRGPQITEFIFHVGRSFLARGHEITIPQDRRETVHLEMDFIERGSIPVAIVNVLGVETHGRLRHGFNNHTAFLQLRSADPEVASGVTHGQEIRVDLRREPDGLRVYLDS